MPEPWPLIVLFALLLWCAFLTYNELRSKLPDYEVEGDMHPKAFLAYMCRDAKFAASHLDRREWFNALKDTLLSALRRGKVAAFGRRPGTMTDLLEDGTRKLRFMYPDNVIDQAFWECGDINWLPTLNADYDGPISAHNFVSGDGFDDVRLCRRQVEIRWPKRPWLSRLIWPIPFDPFETMPSRSPPWRTEGEEPVDVGREPMS